METELFKTGIRIVTGDSENLEGTCHGYNLGKSIFLGTWHSDESQRNMKCGSVLFHVPENTPVQIWGRAKSEHAAATHLGCIISSSEESLGGDDSCRWFFIANLEEWIDDREMEDDLPVLDCQDLFLSIGETAVESSSSIVATPVEVVSQETSEQLLASARRDSDCGFEDEPSITLDNVGSGGGAGGSKSIGGGGGCDSGDTGVSGKFDAFFDGLQEDIEIENEPTFSWWRLGAIVFIVAIILLVMYFCYRVYSRWNLMADCYMSAGGGGFSGGDDDDLYSDTDSYYGGGGGGQQTDEDDDGGSGSGSGSPFSFLSGNW